MKTVFLFQGTEYDTLKEIAAATNRKAIARRDMARIGIEEIVKIDEPVSDEPAVEEGKKEEPQPEQDSQTGQVSVVPDSVPVKGKEPEEPPVAPEPEEPVVSASKEPSKVKENGEKVEKPVSQQPQTGKFSEEVLAKALELRQRIGWEDIEALVAHLKPMKAEHVIKLARDLDLTWKEDTHLGINRMRAAMAIRTVCFPGERRPRPKPSVWKKFSLEELEKLAKKNNLSYRETIDPKVNRMWIIVALNEANVQPPKKVE
ncbi:hypothetical protein D3C74_51110 [compost metagenome]